MKGLNVAMLLLEAVGFSEIQIDYSLNRPWQLISTEFVSLFLVWFFLFLPRNALEIDPKVSR